MDRRYKETRGASRAGLNQREAITRSTTRSARVQAHGAKQYGGSTGGTSSLAGQRSSMPILQNRNADALQRAQTFKALGMGNQFDREFKSDANIFNAGQRDKFRQADMSL